jgi:hypothetical protein
VKRHHLASEKIQARFRRGLTHIYVMQLPIYTTQDRGATSKAHTAHSSTSESSSVGQVRTDPDDEGAAV